MRILQLLRLRYTGRTGSKVAMAGVSKVSR